MRPESCANCSPLIGVVDWLGIRALVAKAGYPNLDTNDRLMIAAAISEVEADGYRAAQRWKTMPELQVYFAPR